MEHGSHWHPHTLNHCVDSDFLAYSIAIMAAGVLIWYWIIASIWWKSMQTATKRARTIWGTLCLIFVVCSIAGYVSWIIALWFPAAAIVIRMTALVLLNFVLCPVFVWYAVRYRFMAYGTFQRFGEHMAGIDFESMSNAELATMTRAFLAELKKPDNFEKEVTKILAMPDRGIQEMMWTGAKVLLDRRIIQRGS